MMIDMRSDTVTRPTEKMRKAMYEAACGDDVYGDDPTVRELELLIASILGKEDAVFVPSGTFGNQLALLTHTRRGDEVIVGEDAHIVAHEVGAAAVIAGVNLRYAKSELGSMELSSIKSLIREDDIHYPRTSLICVENAHGSGTVVKLSHMKDIYNIAKENDLSVHLDGARIFNAATTLSVDASEIAAYADSVNVCLSKGLAAPMGSLLAGDAEFVKRARKNRKLMGGGMRQVGIVAAAGIVALNDMRGRLEVDHYNAKYLAIGLDDIEGISILWDRLDINMVFFTLEREIESSKLVSELKDRDILVNGPEGGEYRLVTNNDVTKEDVDRVIIAMKEILA